MSLSLHVEASYVHGRFSGSLTASDLDALVTGMAGVDPGDPAAANRIADLSDVMRFDVDFPVVLAASARLAGGALPVDGVRTAIVAPSRLQYGFARMYQTLVRETHLTVRIFRDLPSAVAWIRSGSSSPPESR